MPSNTILDHKKPSLDVNSKTLKKVLLGGV